MTIPHLMNCAHADTGWCLDCVKQGVESSDRELEKVRAILQSNWDICENHNIEVCGGGCWVCATINSHPDREKLVGQLRVELKEARGDIGTLLSDLKSKNEQVDAWRYASNKGWHSPDCSAVSWTGPGDTPCSCGLDDAENEARTLDGEPPTQDQ